MREPGRPGWTRGGGVTLPAVRRGGGGGPRGESWEDNIRVWGAWEGAKSPVDEQCRARLDSEVMALVSQLWNTTCEARPPVTAVVQRALLLWPPSETSRSFLPLMLCLILENLDSTYFWQWSPTVPCCSLACEHLSDPGRVDHIRLYVILNCVYFVQHQERTNKKNTDTTSTVCTCWSSALQQRRFRKSSVFVNLLSYTCLNGVLTGSCDVWCIRTNLYL